MRPPLDAGPGDTGPVDAGPGDGAAPDDAPDSGPDAGGGASCRTLDDCVAPDLCTNAQACVNGRCVVTGGPATCDDGVACTTDACDAAAGRCTHTADDTRCENNRFCDRNNGCVTQLSCEVGDATCARLQGDPCSGTWSCDPAQLRCVRSAPYNCDDMDRCTMDVCMMQGSAPTCVHTGPMYDNDVANCGRCGNACMAGANQMATCAMGTCGTVCTPGFVDLDRMPGNGCECNSMAPDMPDLEFQDTNCDGIDGNASQAIFVSPRGDDSNPGTMMAPKRTIRSAFMAAAAARPVRAVYAAAGNYEESVSFVSGVSLYGGYDDTRMWARSRDGITLLSVPSTGAVATRLSQPVEVQLVTIQAADAMTPGQSSYGLRVIQGGATFTLRGSAVSAGAGAAGRDGAAGSQGAPGGNGANASTPSAGGAGGSPCGAPGGQGGQGVSGRRNGNVGGNGATVAGVLGGAGGAAGTQGAGCCASGNGSPAPDNARPGSAGAGGVNGTAADPLGTVSSSDGLYTPPAGTGGTPGIAGTGGGGGGSGGGDAQRLPRVQRRHERRRRWRRRGRLRRRRRRPGHERRRELRRGGGVVAGGDCRLAAHHLARGQRRARRQRRRRRFGRRLRQRRGRHAHGRRGRPRARGRPRRHRRRRRRRIGRAVGVRALCGLSRGAVDVDVRPRRRRIGRPGRHGRRRPCPEWPGRRQRRQPSRGLSVGRARRAGNAPRAGGGRLALARLRGLGQTRRAHAPGVRRQQGS
jgi:hypothetical protein